MKRFCKIAAFCLVLVMAAVIACGCGAKENYDEAIAAVKTGCEKTLAKESGDIYVYKMIKPETEINGIVKKVSEETYVKYVRMENDTDFSMAKYIYDISEEEPVATDIYMIEKVGAQILELKNGVGDFVDSAPDIFADIHCSFESVDVKNALVEDIGKGVNKYTFTMTEDYVNGFDREENGAKLDCTKVVYVYSVDVMSNLSNITREYTYTFTYEGESQTLVEFFDIKAD